ncbi:MAG: replication-relaxation family protein [Planctomycetota bacterium]
MPTKDSPHLTRLQQRLLDLLITHRALTSRQIAVITDGNLASRKRALGQLETQGYVASEPIRLRARPGRPETGWRTTPAGHGVTKRRRGRGAALATVGGRDESMAHRVMLNWVPVQLPSLEAMVPGLTASWRDDATGTIAEQTVELDSGENTSFIPDGVLLLTHAPSGQSLLYFVEADTGTEPLRSNVNPARSLKHKLRVYQAYFRDGGYQKIATRLAQQPRNNRRGNRSSGLHVCGFRLLLVTSNASRFDAVCDLVRATPPAGFIWVTQEDDLVEHGLWASVWAPGGQVGEPAESIVDALCPDPCPSPPWARGEAL